MRKNETNLSLVLACMYLCIGIIQPVQLYANPCAKGIVGASGRLQNLPVIEVSALGEHHLIVPQASEQLLVVTHLTPGERYSLRVPVDPAPGGCMPQVAVEGQVPATLLVDAVVRTLTFVAEETSLTFRLSYPCDWGDPKYPRRHHVSVFCETCLQEAPSAEKVSSNALLQVTPSVNPDSVIRNVFIGNSCFDVQNVTFSGLAHQVGTFTSGETNIGIATGMVMSTANVNVGTGPNNHSGAQFPPHVGVPAVDADLQGLPGYNGFGLNDLAKIEFDFVPTESQVTFEFVFATEEYCEWVDEIYNDVFGFFISGPGIPGGKQNIAVVPNTSTEISVNTINHKTNTSYYTHNIGANSYMIPPLLLSAAQCNAQNNGNPVPYSNSPAINETQFDGFTKVLTATATVIPCETYHIALKIANVGDNRLDAAVFLRAGSFNGGGVAAPQWVVNNKPDSSMTTEGCDNVKLVFERVGATTDSLIIPLIISGTATAGVDYGAIPNPVVIPKDSLSVTLSVPVFQDQLVEGDETIIVKLADSCECSNPQRTLTIKDFSPEILGAPAFLCPGSTVDISVGAYNAYLWAPGGQTSQMITVSVPGTYTVTVTKSGGCTATSSVQIAAGGFEVTTTADSGAGSLRQVIECANSNPGPDGITFNIPGGPPYEIILNTPLPVVSESVYIDATTQPGWSFGDILLLPDDPTGFTAGLEFVASECELHGMVIRGFDEGVGVAVDATNFFTITNSIVDECAVGVQIIGECNFLIEDCIVANNWYYGIDAEFADNVQVRRNTLYCNGTDPGGDPFLPAANAQQPPVILSATLTEISGTATYLPPIPTFPDNIVEVFLSGDPACPDADVQGITFLGDAVVNPDGTWSLSGNFPPSGVITATLTNPAVCTAPCGLIANFSSVSLGVNEVEFTDISTGNPTTHLWDFGDPASGGANTASGPVISHVFSGIGSYQVTLTVTSIVNGVYCEDVEVKTVNIDCPVNAPSFTFQYLGGEEFDFMGMSFGTPTDWFWDFDDNGGVSYEQNPNYTFSNPGLHFVCLTVFYDANGLYCFDTYCNLIDLGGVMRPLLGNTGNNTKKASKSSLPATDAVTSDFSPIFCLGATADISGDLNICAGETTTLTASSGISYEWSTGETTGSINVGSAGDYTVTITVAVNCTASATVSVTVNPLPTANITGDFIICAGETTLLAASGGTSYAWSTGETTEDISVGVAGLYTVTVTDGNACTSTTTIFLTVNSLPTAAISGDLDICIGGTTTLTASGGLSYAWSTGDLTADINVGAAGDYTVTVTDGNGCTDEATVTLVVNPLPMAVISGDLDICAGQSTILTASGGTVYLWSTGANTASTSVGLAGTYTVTVTDGNGCSDTETATVMVNPLPAASITGDFIICAGETTLLTASGGTSYAWSTGETTEDISVGVAGLYTVTVTDGNACTSTTTIFLTVNSLPTAAISGDLDICIGGTTTLTASGGLSYEWSTGDLTADINVGAAGNYTVTVTDGNGCTDEATVALVVNPLPTIGISGDLDICAGQSTILTASGGTVYLWSTGANTASTSVGLAGTYTVTVTDGNGCSDTETATVTVNPLPSANITGDFIICVGETTLLTASGGTSYAWSTGETTESIITSAAGFYTLTVTDGNSCTNTTTSNLTVNPLPTAAISGDLDICIGGTTTLTASGGTSYAWSTGDLTADINVGAAGNYTVTVTDGNGCTDEATVTLVVNPLPVAAILGILDYCIGGNTQLTATGGTNYLWEDNSTDPVRLVTAGTYTVTVTDGNACSNIASVSVTESPTLTVVISGNLEYCAGSSTTLTAAGGVSYLWDDNSTNPMRQVTAGSYTVTATDANGCTGENSVSVTENPLPAAAVSGDLEICAGESTTLTASGGTSYAWSTGDLTADINVGAAGDYTVTVTDGNGCTDEATVTLVVNPLPIIGISGDLDICAGQSTILTASGGTGYLWSTGDNTAATFVGLSGTYTVTVTDANTCTSTAEAMVTVNPLPAANITGDFNICAGETTLLTASGGTSYAWSTGETTEDISVGVAGLYTVTVTDGNACTSTTTIFLTVNSLPTAAISGDLDICIGGTTTLTASGGLSYAWSTGDLTAGINVGAAGNYTVTVTDGNGCTDEATATLVVNPLPIIGISGDLDICLGQSTILTASGGTVYLWSTGANTAATSVGLSGTYTVTVTDANTCTSTAEATVTVNPLPTANITGDFNICAGETTLLTASGGTSYAWSTGETTEDISVGVAGLYTVTVTDGNACTSTTTIFLTVNPLPTAVISGDLEVCAGGVTTLTASGGTGYAWSTAEVTADISVGMAGGYTVTVTDGNGCTDTEAVSVSELGYVVTTTADSGPGSFRQTLECARDIPGTNVITFNIPGSGPFEIKLTTPLPSVSDSTIIDATTQPGWSLGQIVLMPASPGLIPEGLTVTANKCQVSGLAFSGFAAAGVYATGANDFALRNCRVDSCSTGVLVEASVRSVVENCVIAHNQVSGIDAGTALFVQVVQNSLYCNGGDPFVPASDATAPPAIDSATTTIISGTATYVPDAQSSVEIYTVKDPTCPGADVQGKTYLAKANIQPDGKWSVSGNFTPGTQLTAAQTYYLDAFVAPPDVAAKGSAAILPPPDNASTSDFSPPACVGYSTTIVQPLCAGEVFNFNGTDYGVTGTYIANLVASDGCDSVVTLILQVFPVFIAVQQASICAGDSLIVGGSFQTEQGLYVDTLQKANGCDSIVYTFLFINDLPTVAISAPNVICPGDMAALSVAGNFNGYLWGPNGAQTSAITIDTAGTYSVTVTDINGCTAADTVDIVEYCNSVTALFEVSQDTACIAHFVQFTDKSSPNTTSWLWDFGNGNFSTEQNPFDIYPLPGTYTITLVAFDGVGSDTFKTSLFVYDSMATNFLFAIPDSCTPNYVQFTDAITTVFPIATWQWNFGDGQFGNSSSPGHLYEVFDTANVNLTITDIYNCTTSISRNVEVIDFGRTPAPVFRNIALCENQPYLGVLYAQDTTLVDTLVAASGCDSIVVTNISVDPLPGQSADAGPDADVCLGPGILTLQAAPAGIGYGTWTALTPDVSINNVNNPNTTVSNLSDGANIFVWSLSNGACVNYSRDTVVLNIIPAPGEIAEAGDDVLFCQQLPTTTLAATPPVLPGVTGIWSQSVAQAQSGVVIADPANWNTSVSGLKPGNVYEFRWTLRTALCGDFSSDVVRINLTLEQANAGPNQQTCPQESETVLQANLPAGATGQWRTAGATTAVIELPQSAETDVSGLVVGANLFIWTLSAPGCPDYTSDTVVVTAYGAFEAKEDVFFNLGQSSTLRLDVLANDVLPNSPFITVTALLPVPDGLSDNGDGSFTYLFDTVFQEKIIFRYRVCVADCPGLCDDATVTILSEPPPTPAPPIQPPKNVITPNEDGVGDALKIPNFETYANDIELIILSRWGDVVYQTKRYDNNWQGVNSNGKPLPDGTYYYIIRAGVQDNLVINGTITILR